MKRFLMMTLACGLVASLLTSPAAAYPQFAKEFKNLYLGEESTPTQQKLAALEKEAKCNVCHDPRPGPDGKKSKKNRNDYGKALSKLLGKEDKKDVPKIHAALKKVESEKAEGASETFGARLEAGKLPVDPPAEE